MRWNFCQSFDIQPRSFIIRLSQARRRATVDDITKTSSSLGPSVTTVRGRSGRETELPIRNCPIYRELFKEFYVSLSVLFWNLWEQPIVLKSAWSGPRINESYRCVSVCLSIDWLNNNICLTHIVNIWGHGFLNLHDHNVCL